MEQVSATILYDLRDRETIGQYLENWLNYTNKAQADFEVEVERSPLTQ
ncbi:MAG: hypothetical protein MGG11_18905 [Trichodesmium sp. MAG_R03]|nr:hypothetical protein [Trichodesmium sp. MAG_R03]